MNLNFDVQRLSSSRAYCYQNCSKRSNPQQTFAVTQRLQAILTSYGQSLIEEFIESHQFMKYDSNV